MIVEDSSDEVSAGSDEAGCSDDVSMKSQQVQMMKSQRVQMMRFQQVEKIQQTEKIQLVQKMFQLVVQKTMQQQWQQQTALDICRHPSSMDPHTTTEQMKFPN